MRRISNKLTSVRTSLRSTQFVSQRFTQQQQQQRSFNNYNGFLFQQQQQQQQNETKQESSSSSTTTTTTTTATPVKQATPPRANVAVILSGCGFMDGTDVTEAVSLLVQLSRLNVSTQFFAPDKEIEVSMNYTTKVADHGEERFIVKEAARITRGNVKNIDRLADNVSSFDAVFVLGGSGAIRNLANYELEKYKLEFAEADPSVAKAIKSFHSSGKPIATSAHGGILVAGVLGKKNNGPGIQVTLGKSGEKEQYEVVNALGNKALDSVNIVIDEQNSIVSTGGCLNTPNVDPLDLYNSMISLVDETLKLAKK